MGSFITCCGGWKLTETAPEEPAEAPGPLPRPNLRLTAIFIAVVVVGLAVGWALSSGPPEIATVGERAPGFTVETLDGDFFTLSEARGRKVVLNLWASWCGPCREEIPAISAFADNNPDVVVVGVAVNDSESAARQFAEEIGATYELMLGDADFEDAYPFFGLPATYIIDENGVVSEFFNGIVDEELLSELVG